MKDLVIYYFSGTGNSLFVAKEIASRLGGEIESIPKTMKTANGSGTIKLEGARKIGIIFPVYAYTYPKIINNFLSKVCFKTLPEYIFLINTFGSSPGSSAYQLSKRLKKHGYIVNYINNIVMPENYIAIFKPDDEQTVSKKIQAAREKIKLICQDISESKEYLYSKKLFDGVKTAFVGSVFNGFLRFSHLMFFADKRCNGCGVCAKACPASNIIIKDSKPKWKNKCAQCMACLNLCPSCAIQYTSITKRRLRYRNPEIKPSELYLYNGNNGNGIHN